MSTVATLTRPERELCTVVLVERPDGRYGANIAHMPPGIMLRESAGADPGYEVADRMRSVAIWLRDAADDMIRQAQALEAPVGK